MSQLITPSMNIDRKVSTKGALWIPTLINLIQASAPKKWCCTDM